jgi:CRP/FNR family transcriptional regulator, polysaccharide utilization system transcription regulator
MPKFAKTQSCQDCKKKITLFDLLSPEELEKVNEKRYEVHFNAGETIFKQGTSLTHIICMTSGLLKVYLEGYNKKNYILELIKPGEVVGGPGLYTDDRHHFSVSAVIDSTACFLETSVFQDLIQNNNNFAIELIRRGNLRDIRNFDRIINLTQKQMPGRVADTLLYIYKVIYKTNPCYLMVSRQELAEMSSLTKESFIRILKEFKDTGLISLEGNELKILNEKALQNISDNG